jgi:orotidine-5'-phosphate decarboxylase
METTLNKPVTARSAKDKLIVALDFETAREAFTLFSALRDVVGMFKVGSQLFTAEGPGIVRDIVRTGGRIFLDLKFHDIPNTVAAAGVEATRLGVSMFNVHSSGGSAMMRRTADAVAECAMREGLARPAILGVTVLTSSNQAALEETGMRERPDEIVALLAQLTAHSGLDGVVASAREVPLIRTAVTKPDFVVVTPGVRPAGTSKDDQERVMSPRQAIAAGADYLVIGRPIIAAPDPARAAVSILEEMGSSVATNSS